MEVCACVQGRGKQGRGKYTAGLCNGEDRKHGTKIHSCGKSKSTSSTDGVD